MEDFHVLLVIKNNYWFRISIVTNIARTSEWQTFRFSLQMVCILKRYIIISISFDPDYTYILLTLANLFSKSVYFASI